MMVWGPPLAVIVLAAVASVILARRTKPEGEAPTGDESPLAGITPFWRGVFVGGVTVGAIVFVSMKAMETGSQATAGMPHGEESAPGVDPRIPDLLIRLASNPNDIEALDMLTELSFNSDDLDKARTFNEQALAVNPKDKHARVFRGVIATLSDDGETGRRSIEEVLAEDPNDLTALVYHGLVMLDMGENPAAIASLEHALQIDPKLPGVAHALERARAVGAPPMVSGTLSLASEASIPDGAVVFVSVRGPEGGPPVAATKLPAKGFPIDFKLTAADAAAMGGDGGAVPENMRLVARVDYDGNAITKEDGAPIAEADVTRGQTALALTLR